VEELNRSISEMEGEVSEINHLLYPSLSTENENDDFFISAPVNTSSGASYGSLSMDNGNGLGNQNNDPLVRNFMASYYRKKELNKKKLKAPPDTANISSTNNTSDNNSFDKDVMKEEEVVVCYIFIIFITIIFIKMSVSELNDVMISISDSLQWIDEQVYIIRGKEQEARNIINQRRKELENMLAF
jgi:hypothetical protein